LAGHPILAVLGPTGVGKTAVAVEVAERLGGEIVGCDALQVYRGLDAATAKPTAQQRARVMHHVVDCVDPRERFTAGRYVRMADEAIAVARSRGRVPIVVGGTGMYFRALMRGLAELPETDVTLRERLRKIAERRGPEALHRMLTGIDPRSAARLAPRDVQRVVRGLELAIGAGRTWSESLAGAGTWGRTDERMSAVKVALDLERGELARRLEARVREFFERGLIDEVRGLLDSGVPEAAGAFAAIGYREATEVVRGRSSLDVAIARAQRRTRQLAKRQRTWIRSERGVTWIDASAGAIEAAGRIVTVWRERSGSEAP